MNILGFIKKKYIRLQGSRNILKFNYFIEKIFRDKKLGNVGFNFSNKVNRQTLVQKIINIKKYNSYLEIGTFHDELFQHVECKKKVGVDPVSGGTERKTSDQFFKNNKDTFDCIFIDGLHYYSQVKKDIENSLKILNPNGIILLHDCLPNNYFEQAVPRCQITWNGDVWKAIVECRTDENIDTYTCYADFGVGVIFNRKNKNILKIDNQDFSKLKFEEYFYNHKKFMNIIEYEDLIKII
tara:strand:+ start:1272 stop:1988 length:717 start_codon:yes stop_codon:yes gene_type:complete